MFTENKTTELKREYVDDIKNTAIAFANCDGGTLYVGIEDDGTVRGVDDADGTMLRVTNAIRDAVRPDLTMFLHSKGIRPEGVFVRQGASTVPASEAAILDMIKETSGDSYEAARSLEQRLNFEQASAFFRSRNVAFGPSQMRTLHLIGPDGTYTNLAFLLSDQCNHTVKLAVFEGSKKSVFKDRQELTGSLLQQLEDAYGYIDRFNRTRAEFSGLDRVDIRDYPPEAVREALLNALVHRDYAFSGPTLISIFEDRIEFVTIGGLARGIGLEDIRLGVSVLRNPDLANIFYRLRLIEAYGTGILRIHECYAGAAVQPAIEATDHAFKITLPNLNFSREAENTPPARPATSLGKREARVQKVIGLCRENGWVVRKDVEAALGVSQATAILLLREMTRDGLLEKQGTAKNLRYYLAEM